MTIKILDSADNGFYFVIIADNGEAIATSETYTRKDKAIQTALLMQGANFEIGDFTVRKKPVKKQKVSSDTTK